MCDMRGWVWHGTTLGVAQRLLVPRYPSSRLEWHVARQYPVPSAAYSIAIGSTTVPSVNRAVARAWVLARLSLL
eukprot:6418453-Prymnesium_polylepis.1